MNSLKKSFFSIVVMMVTLVTTSMAQKFGHINSQQLLVESPKVKTADASLETYQNQLISKGETMVKAFEAEYQKYVTEANAKTLSPLQMQQREAALTTQQESIQKYEREVQEKLAMKREELYKPILEEANKAIEAIGAEGNYTMIFDTASGAMLFVDKSEDLLAKVKAKLGW